MSPDSRLVKERVAVRLLVVSADKVLLQEDSDPGITGSRWWVTPGGGIEPGEELKFAGARELWEETGLAVEPDQLRGPVAHRIVTHGYSDRILHQKETFFRVEVAEFEPHPQALTVTELQRMRGHAWFPIAALPEVVWPAELPRLLAWRCGEQLDLGWSEESTVPVA